MERIIRTLKILGISFIIGVGFKYLAENLLSKNITSSEPKGWYLTLPYVSLGKNDLVLLCLAKPYSELAKRLGLPAISNECALNSPYILKKIAGIPGDKIEINPDGVFINGILQPTSRAIIKFRGIALNPLPVGYTHRLQTDEYWVMGSGAHSFDSRYFGVINKNAMYKKADLILKR